MLYLTYSLCLMVGFSRRCQIRMRKASMLLNPETILCLHKTHAECRRRRENKGWRFWFAFGIWQRVVGVGNHGAVYVLGQPAADVGVASPVFASLQCAVQWSYLDAAVSIGRSFQPIRLLSRCTAVGGVAAVPCGCMTPSHSRNVRAFLTTKDKTRTCFDGLAYS